LTLNTLKEGALSPFFHARETNNLDWFAKRSVKVHLEIVRTCMWVMVVRRNFDKA
jgi:hypothetical protein